MLYYSKRLCRNKLHGLLRFLGMGAAFTSFLSRNSCTVYHKINETCYICILYDKLRCFMTKTTMGTKMPRKLERELQIVGEQIKMARLRRNLSIALVAERATCSPLTVARVEKGASTVAIGIYLRVLYALQLEADILLLAKEDPMGKALQDLSLKTRKRASKK